jgi:hypothetical protein
MFFNLQPRQPSQPTEPQKRKCESTKIWRKNGTQSRFHWPSKLTVHSAQQSQLWPSYSPRMSTRISWTTSSNFEALTSSSCAQCLRLSAPRMPLSFMAPVSSLRVRLTTRQRNRQIHYYDSCMIYFSFFYYFFFIISIILYFYNLYFCLLFFHFVSLPPSSLPILSFFPSLCVLLFVCASYFNFLFCI